MDKNIFIGVLTYNVPHRKTFDTLCLLKAVGYCNVKIFAKPMSYKKQFAPLLQHRPNMENMSEFNLYPSEIAKNFDYSFCDISSYDEIKETQSIFLVCGAGLLPEFFYKNNIVINAHPGYIPSSRGLDAFKWAIYENKPIGVSTHLIGDEVDAGVVIERRIIAVRQGDSIHSVAQKVYETEIKMLVLAIETASQSHQYIGGGDNIIHKRMTNEIERLLPDCFDAYINANTTL